MLLQMAVFCVLMGFPHSSVKNLSAVQETPVREDMLEKG